MNFMDELKKLTRPYDDDGALIDDELDEFGLGDDAGEPAYNRPAAAAPVNNAPVDAPINMGAAPQMGGMGAMGGMNEAPRPNVTTMNMGGAAEISKYRVVLVKPEKFDCATVIAKHLCQGDAVILNCEETHEDIARRVVDFLSGCAFALDGSIKKASKNVYIIAPKDVGVDDTESESEETA